MSNGVSKTAFFKSMAIGFILLNASFFTVHYLKYGTLALTPLYKQLLILFYCSWLLISLLTKKFNPGSYTRYWTSILVLIRSDLFLLFFVSFWVVVMGISRYSRIQIFGSIGLLFFAEVVIFNMYYLLRRQELQTVEVVKTKYEGSNILLISDFVLMTLTFFLVHYLKRKTFIPDREYEILFYVMAGLWAVTAILTRKFDKRHFTSFLHAVAPCVKSVIFMAFIMTTLIFGMQMFNYSRIQIFTFMALFLSMEIILWFIYFNSYENNNQDVESAQEARSIMKQEYLSANQKYEDRISVLYQPIKERMKDFYFKDQPQVFDFFNRSVNLSEITRIETLILDTSEPINFNLISLSHTQLMINLHKINNIRWINRYFLQCHEILIDGGYLAGRAITNDVFKKLVDKKYPKYFRELFFAVHFLWARILPKLNITKRLYFKITKGKRRAISRSELLGRLFFCGFQVIAGEYIDDIFHFIAQKVKMPSLDENPSYGPVVRLERIGADGKLINIYKFRTMHPYSEYLQEYVHKQNQLRDGGKFKDDFRVAGYGKTIRKLWLDELPMLYNWVKGDLQLVGVRPLSHQYLSLYTAELRKLRKKVKPGLVPPFYADLPRTLDEIMASEERYIKSYLEKPFSTQWRYFWKCFWNIVVKKARSA